MHGDIPAQRWLEDGSLVIDGLASDTIYDYQKWEFPQGGLDPDPGEIFIMRWRMRVDTLAGYDDPTIAVFSDQSPNGRHYVMSFRYRYDAVEDWHSQSASIAPGVFHNYEMRSPDMRTYTLYIDGTLALGGLFEDNVFGPARVAWGDAVFGAASISRWDYVQFGVVPEPGGAVSGLFWVSTMAAAWWRREPRVSATKR